MPKIKFDVSDQDPEDSVGGNFEPPKPGVYVCKVKEIEDTESKKGDPMLKVVYTVEQEGKHKGAWLFDYIMMTEASKWRLDQFLLAVGVATKKKRKGQFDTDDIIGTNVKVRVKADTNQDGEYAAKVGSVMSYNPDEDDAGDELGDDVDDDLEDIDDDEELEDLEDDDEEILDDEDEEILDDDEEIEEDGEYLTEDDLKAMDNDTLKATAADFDVTIKGKKKSAIIAEILEAQAAPEANAGYSDWTMAQLKAELKERGLKTSGKQAELVARLEEDDEEEPF